MPPTLTLLWLVLHGWAAQAATPSPTNGTNQPPKAKDLAVVLPARGNAKVGADEELFPTAWWDAVHAAFQQTSVGNALETENKLTDWRLVAIRFAPCQPLLPYMTPRNDLLCQPELRLVWQPVTQKYLRDRWTAYADDRAIHALYKFAPETGLNADQAQRWTDLRARAEGISVADEREFDLLNRQLVRAIIDRLLALRGKHEPSSYDSVGERPELANAETAAAFLGRLSDFLKTYAKPSKLTQLTAFSLPEGRDPPMIDEWVFIAFEPDQGGRALQRQELTVKSARDGRVLASYGLKARGTVRRDEEDLLDLKDQLQGADHDELEEAVIWTFPERKLKAKRIADPRRTHVAHTSCISCHKLGPLNFDLHNLSYFEDHDISVSPRVEQDVKRELQWLGLDTVRN